MDPQAEWLIMMYPRNAGGPIDVDDELSYFLSIRANERITYGYNPRPAR
jgi:hypothetical protein